MRRRQFIASTALVVVPLAGCAHPSVVLDMQAATDDDIADEVSLYPDPEAETYRVVAESVDNGSTTRRGRYELFDRTSTVRLDDRFYEMNETEVSRGEVTVYEVLIDFDPAETTPNLGEIAYTDLPAVDRQRLGRILAESPPEGEGYDVGASYGSAEEVGNDSEFVPEQEYDILMYEGERYRVGVDSRTATETTYRYTATAVASSVEAFADRVRERYLFTLAGLSSAERDVVEDAIDGGYFEDSEAFRSVADRIRTHEGIDVAEFYGTWLLEYDGTEYLTYAEW